LKNLICHLSVIIPQCLATVYSWRKQALAQLTPKTEPLAGVIHAKGILQQLHFAAIQSNLSGNRQYPFSALSCSHFTAREQFCNVESVLG
jgi:hypothetical protein